MWAIVGTCVAAYLLLGVILISCILYAEWYKGENICWDTLLHAPWVCAIWPLVALELLAEWWKHFMAERARNRGESPMPLSERVAIKGRLSARVERALRE